MSAPEKHMNLEIGPGKNPIDPSWTLMDVVENPHVDVLHDLREHPLPFPDEAFALVYMSHVLEHIPWTETLAVLKEIYRIIRPKGVIEIWVPDLMKLIEGYLDFDNCGDQWRKFNPDNDETVWFNGRMFTYGPGDENWHRAVFDYRYLSKCLLSVGFRRVDRIYKPRGYDHGWINLGVAATK